MSKVDVARLRAEQISGSIARHGEGPLWDPVRQSLMLVDMLEGDVLTFDIGATAADQVTRDHVDSVTALIRPRVGGGFVVAGERSFVLIDPGGGRHRLPAVFDDPRIRFNEGSCTPDGALLCGTMAYDETPGAGSVYRLDPDGTVTIVVPDTSVSNGIGFSPDGGTAYFSDTGTGRVDSFTVVGGRLVERRPFVSIPAGCGAPDGLAVDELGGVWIALWGGSAVRHYDPSGDLLAIVEIPTPQVTSCAFGGPRLRDLFITTSSLGLPKGREQRAGAIFHTSPGVAGQPTLAFAG